MAAEILLLAGVRHHNPGAVAPQLAVPPRAVPADRLARPAAGRGGWRALLGVTAGEPLGRGPGRSPPASSGFPAWSSASPAAWPCWCGVSRTAGLRAYNAPSDFLNLGVFIAWMGVALVAHAAEGGFASSARRERGAARRRARRRSRRRSRWNWAWARRSWSGCRCRACSTSSPSTSSTTASAGRTRPTRAAARSSNACSRP